ncbi:MAG: aminoglycoside phosphotransferase family protein [Phycisphaeraceae bacterium]
MIGSDPSAESALDEAEVSATGAMLAQRGIQSDACIKQVRGGGNNRVFRVEAQGQTFLLKKYFRDDDDTRDRLGTEFDFCSFATSRGIASIPMPLARDDDHGLALYEFIPGRSLGRDEVNVEHVEQALNFCRRLNRLRTELEAGTLSEASEACFSIATHLRCVDHRVSALTSIETEGDATKAAGEFVHHRLEPAWTLVRSKVQRAAMLEGIDVDRELARDERVLSPSDFGFHNAIREGGGRLRFVDFEYAGWDDPAKLVCDFFCQPALPVPGQFFDLFSETLAEDLSKSNVLTRRIALLRPVYQIKWCCIMLNVFLPTGRRRRDFARTDAQIESARRSQLHKAEHALAAMDSRIN